MYEYIMRNEEINRGRWAVTLYKDSLGGCILHWYNTRINFIVGYHERRKRRLVRTNIVGQSYCLIRSILIRFQTNCISIFDFCFIKGPPIISNKNEPSKILKLTSRSPLHQLLSSQEVESAFFALEQVDTMVLQVSVVHGLLSLQNRFFERHCVLSAGQFPKISAKTPLYCRLERKKSRTKPIERILLAIITGD